MANFKIIFMLFFITSILPTDASFSTLQYEVINVDPETVKLGSFREEITVSYFACAGLALSLDSKVFCYNEDGRCYIIHGRICAVSGMPSAGWKCLTTG